MRIEISAGGVVFRIKNKEPEILMIRDHNGKWTFPKGLIEDNEDKIKTAKREIEEEVGLKEIKYICILSPIKYWFRWQGEFVSKTVYYFLFQAMGNEKPVPQDDEGISQAKWFACKKALRIAGYKRTGQKLIEEAIEKIRVIK